MNKYILFLNICLFTILISCGEKQKEIKTNQEKTEKVKGEDETCTKCNKGTMKLRKSVYGQFLGCSNYPKCKTVIQIEKK